VQNPLVRQASLLVLVVLALVVAPAPSAAAPPKKPTAASTAENEARAAIKRGFALAARGEYADALAQYERAKVLVPGAKMPYRYAAQVLIDLGRGEEAIANFEKYLEIDPRANDADVVRARIAELAAKLPGKIALTSSPEGASVFVDGASAEVGVTPLPELALPAGEHVVAVERAGFERVERKVLLAANQRVELSLELVKTPPRVEPPAAVVAVPREPRAPEAPSSSSSSSSSSSRTAIGLGVAGVGVGLLVTSFVLDRAVASTRDEFDKERVQGGDALSVKERGDTQRTWMVVTLVGGGVLLAGGLTLALWPSSRSKVAIHPTGAAWTTRF
jgi:tetratricopeptide (TPR) repeat protein